MREKTQVDKFGLKLQLIGGLIAAAWGHFHPLIQALVTLMALDMATGILSAYVRKVMSSDVSRRGVAKKVLVLIMVATTEILARHLSATSGWPEVPLASAAAGFYCLNEIISIMENVAKAGLPVPPGVKAALEKLKPLQEEKR